MRDLSEGPGRVLVFVYGVFAVAATGRSAVQLGTEAGKAPFAYSLSLVAAVIYLVATTCLLLGGRRAWQVAVVSCTIELLGVIGIGILSYVDTELFPDKTVWSHFGQGYGFLPLVLPFVGLAWLRATRPALRDGAGAPPQGP